MCLKDYLLDKIGIAILNLVSLIFAGVFLSILGNSNGIITIVAICWVFIFICYIVIDYLGRKKHFDELFAIINSLDKKYLFYECTPKPKTYYDKAYANLLHMAGKSMTEAIAEEKRQSKEYKEYVEQWVHEIKMPITAVQLICKNNKTEVSQKILTQMEQMHSLVESSLFYARSSYFEKDFFIKETSLFTVTSEALANNKQLLMQNGAVVNTNGLDKNVYTDGKWVEFILSQILQNSTKYKKSNESLKLHIQADIEERGLVLSLQDNGMGIAENEIGRVFDKGFTGSTGRTGKNSTGIGLYLCKKLCLKMGLEIELQSVQNEYTKIEIIFPKSAVV